MKKYIFGMILLLSVIGISAFSYSAKSNAKSEPKAKATKTCQWYQLKSGGSSTNPNDYDPVNDQPCDGQTTTVCGVCAPDDPTNPGHPDLSGSPQYVFERP